MHQGRQPPQTFDGVLPAVGSGLCHAVLGHDYSGMVGGFVMDKEAIRKNIADLEREIWMWRWELEQIETKERRVVETWWAEAEERAKEDL